MSFGDQLRAFAKKVEARHQAVFTGSVDLAHESIVEGSPITGAPGQPVGQYGPGYHPGKVGGTLKASWQRWFESTRIAHIATDAPYARQEEDGISYSHGGTPITQRSSVGGSHSVKLTIAAWPRIVEVVTARVREQG